MHKYLMILACSALMLTGCGGSSDSSGDKNTDDNRQKNNSSDNSGGTGSTNDTRINAQSWLDAHNQYRRQHQVADLKWSDEIAKSAQDFVDTCPTKHSDSPYGENMAFSTLKQSADNVVARWYKEVSQYNYQKPMYSSSIGHFTQVVWKNTTHIGCAQASSCSGEWKDIVVCQYNPPGNYSGRFAENVLPKK